MKTHCRCRKCRTRRVLKRHPETYVTQPKCRHCGARDFAADKWMNERKVVTCTCDGYKHIHQLGSTHCKFLKSGEYRDGPIITLPGIDLGF